MFQIEDIAQMVQAYMGETIYLPIFLCCLLFCYCTGKETSRKRMLLSALLSIVLVFNNFSMRMIGKVTDIITYYRFLWAVPILFIIAYTVTKSIYGHKKPLDKAVAIGFALLLFLGWGSSFLTESCRWFPENKYNLPSETIAICDMIAQDKSTERPVVAFDMGTQLSARLYDPSLVWAIRRTAYTQHNDTEGYGSAGKYRPDKILIHAVNYGMQGEPKRLSHALSKKKVDYLVTFTSYGMDAYLEGLGYPLLGRCGEKSVYAKALPE
ncbi:MAG: hypothetical protein HFH38_02610 [Lachnospiraceae bacterium]|jgi:hypothetical protein|nr:hypothetical protein [Lachnospiraceae bacterium]